MPNSLPLSLHSPDQTPGAALCPASVPSCTNSSAPAPLCALVGRCVPRTLLPSLPHEAYVLFARLLQPPQLILPRTSMHQISSSLFPCPLPGAPPPDSQGGRSRSCAATSDASPAACLACRLYAFQNECKTTQPLVNRSTAQRRPTRGRAACNEQQGVRAGRRAGCHSVGRGLNAGDCWEAG